MANRKHVAKLKEGREAWNQWRETSDETPDLSGIEIFGDALDIFDFTATNFADARISEVSFFGAKCEASSFRRAQITSATFRHTSLNKADFTDARIMGSSFIWCDLDKSEFKPRVLATTVFARVSMRDTHGIDGIETIAANSIGLDTFFDSAGLPERFLRGARVPEEFIQYASSLVGKAIEYYSCFLSYSSKDDEFARRLYNDLQGKNIRTWFAPEELKIGDRFRSRIDESIRIHDKLVIILSANSVNSDWVETEVASAIEREQKEGKDVLFPIAIDEEGFTSKQPWAKDIRLKRHIGDFRKWKSHDDYTAAFDRLVRDLKKSQPPIIMKGG